MIPYAPYGCPHDFGPPTHHNNAIPCFHRWQHIGHGCIHGCMAEVDTLEDEPSNWGIQKGTCGELP